MPFLTPPELASLGLASFGDNVLISDRAAIYGAARIRIGSNVRIDDFCVLSAGDGGIVIGSYVHIAFFSSMVGAGLIQIDDFAGLSSRVSLYSSSDDYSGRTLTNPTVPDRFKAVVHRPVHVGRHVILGCGSVVLPGVTLHPGSAVGALSLVKSDCEPFTIYGGNPARRLGRRSESLLQQEQALLGEVSDG